MKKRKLGGKIEVSEIGYGCFGLSGVYGAANDAESIAVIHKAVELGVTMLDTADAYGPFHNEELLGKALPGIRDKVIVVAPPNDVITAASFTGFTTIFMVAEIRPLPASFTV